MYFVYDTWCTHCPDEINVHPYTERLAVIGNEGSKRDLIYITFCRKITNLLYD